MLLELIVSLAILSSGLLAITRSFILSLETSNHSRLYSTASMLAEEKLAELEESLQVPDGTTYGSFGEPYSRFSWNLEVEPSSNQNLKHVRITVSWKERGLEKRAGLSTLLYETPEI
jgi:general secretion pathway protein I